MDGHELPPIPFSSQGVFLTKQMLEHISTYVAFHMHYIKGVPYWKLLNQHKLVQH